MYKLVFFVPDTHKELVKEAIFNAGAGHFDGYDCCSWETQGMGQFRPLDNSQPFIGENGKLEQDYQSCCLSVETRTSIRRACLSVLAS